MRTSSARRRRGGRLTAVLSGSVLAVAVGALLFMAVDAQGIPVQHAALDNGGIWVTSDGAGLFGRLNKPAGALDAAFAPPGSGQQSYQLDMLQDQSAVVAWDQASGKLYPVDSAQATALSDQSVPVSAAQQVGLDGGTVAVLDPSTGEVWAQRFDPSSSLTSLVALQPDSPAVARLGAVASPNDEAMAVGQDGTVYAVSSAGKLATIAPLGADGFAPVRYSSLGHSLTEPRVTTVGAQAVVLDAADGKLFVPGGPTVSVPGVDPHTALQQPGPADGSVVLATSHDLLSVDLTGGVISTLSNIGGGAPAAPVRLGACVYAAWAQTPDGYARSCDGAPAVRGGLSRLQELVDPEFRVNWNQIVLNDLATGGLWDLSDAREVDDWSAVQPPASAQNSSNSQTNLDVQQAANLPPKAQDITLGARPGRTTVLHVLDVDSDPSGAILAVESVTAPDNPAASLQIAPDSQSVEITLPAGIQPAPIHFQYTVDDGKGLSATATVTVDVRTPGENALPALRDGYTARTWTVPSGGSLKIPVLQDWRDFDGDPLALVAAAATAGSAAATSDGFIEYTAPVSGGGQTVHYQVSDGIGAPVAGSLAIQVQSPTDTAGVAPIAEPNLARGEVGQPIVIHPLANALPGADPQDPGATLELAAPLASPAGATVTTDQTDGTVTVVAQRPGTYLLSYTVQFGDVPFASGGIRVDVTADPASPQPPVTMPTVAVLHGQQPATVDVLAQDFDPSGALLEVQRAAPVDPDSGLQVGIVDGRWLRISALSPTASAVPQLIDYTVTDGVTGPVTGQVSVTQLAAPAVDTPLTVPTYATVRAGDTVTSDVLAKDIDLAGAPLSLAADVPGAPSAGQLEVLSPSGTAGAANGSAYVTGGQVTFAAPSVVASPVVETVEYLARNATGGQAVGYLYVTVNPPPSAMDPNRAPAPPPIQERTVAGDTVTIPISTSGVDPDGDSVTLGGIESAPGLGRILSQNATSLTYQAFPTSSGTDTFTYQVADRFGATGQSTISIAVVPPATPQPPIAVNEDVTAAPGAQISVDVLGDAVAAADDTLSVTPLSTLNRPLPAGVSQGSATSPILVTAPAADGKPLVITYGVTDGVNPVSVATITVHGQSGYLNPPLAVPTYANPLPKQSTIAVDVLSHVTGPDGSASGLTVTQVYAASAKISGAKVVLPVTASPQTVAYQVRDAAGASTIGMIYVSAPGYGAPYAKPGALVSVPRGGSTTIKLADYVVDPAGRAVRLTTTAEIWSAPAADLKAAPSGDNALTLTAPNGYTGPASVTFQVTDGASLTDPHGQYSVISIPVQVGPETPVLRCPSDQVRVVEGGPSVSLDIASLCHVWTAQPGQAASLHYTAQWLGAAPGLSVSGSGTDAPSVSAESSATAQSSGTLAIGVAGSPAKTSQLTVQAIAAAAPTVAPVAVNGVEAGQTATIDVAPYISSQLREPVDSVVSVSQTSGMAASASSAGSVVHITPGATSHGAMTFTVVVSDVAQTSRTDRRGVGQITLNVLGPPAAPGTPVVGGTVLSGAVQLSWTAPADNGAPIESYQVDYGGGTQTCPASPCTITGLTNGVTYTFAVKAQNVVGWSPASGQSGPATPNTVPGAAGGLAVSDPQNGTLKLSWSAAPDQGTPVLDYAVTWTGGGSATVSGTSFTATGLVNDTVYTFTVIPVNRQGPGPAATVSGESAGAPAQPAAPTFAASELAGSDSRAVTVSWTAVDPNGPGPTTYTVTRTGGSGTDTVCTNVSATDCLDAGIANDGTTYTYTVTAMNADASLAPSAHTSPPSPGTVMEASYTPDPITDLTATPTGVSGQVTLSFDAPASHGASSTVECTDGTGPCGPWTLPTTGGTTETETVNDLPNGTADTLDLDDCNGSGSAAQTGSDCDAADSVTVTPYGPLQGLSISTSASSQTVNFTVSVDPDGKAATVQISTSKQSQTFTTGTGEWSWSSSDDMGYSATDVINVTVSDPGRASISQSASQSTPPPPPPATVTVSQGAACGGGGGSACEGGSCASSSCAYIHVATANFSGSVTCSFDSSVGPEGFVNETYAANQSKDSYNWFGYPGDTVTVTCGGVSGSYVWP